MMITMANNTVPSLPQAQDHDDNISEPSKDQVRPPNGSISEESDADCAGSTISSASSSSTPTQTTKLLVSSFRTNFRNGGRSSSFDNSKSFRSSLCTIESATAGNDIYSDDEDDNENSKTGSQNDLRSNGSDGTQKPISRPPPPRRRRSKTMCMDRSSASTLMVSFSRLNEQELTHLRKWNRRLLRTEVFQKYYFPAKWEANEMEALIGVLKLEDPTLNTGGGMRGGSLRGSNTGGGIRGGSLRGSGNKNAQRTRGNRRGVGKGQASGSWQSGDKLSSSGLSSSLTSSWKDTTGKLSKLLTDPKPRQTIDQTKLTKQALDSIFFPYVHDPKSVLLKRGSVFLSDNKLPSSPCLHNNERERELMIFTHGFVLADVVFEDAVGLFLALSDRDFLTEKSFLDYLKVKFREMESLMDGEENGTIEKWELQRLFTDMGIPMGESVLDELIQRTVSSTTAATTKTHLDQTDKVDWKALHKSLQGVFVQKQNNAKSPSPNVNSLGGDDSEGSVRRVSDPEGAGGGTGLKKLFGSFKRRKTTKADHASLFSNVVRVDSLNMCHGDDPVSKNIASSTYATTSLSVTLSGHENDPLILVCPKTEHRDSWVEAFRPGVVHAWTKSLSPEMTELRNMIGWQHLVIRSSFISLVILNDVEALKCAFLEGSGKGILCRKLRLELNSLDEYNGYSPLHYATILCHTECMAVLLEAGSKVTLEDREGLSPMYHALSLRNDEVANVLEKFGADRSEDLCKLIAHEIKAEDLKNPSQTDANGRLETHIENSFGSLPSNLSSSDRAGGDGGEEDINELLMQAAIKFGGT